MLVTRIGKANAQFFKKLSVENGVDLFLNKHFCGLFLHTHFFIRKIFMRHRASKTPEPLRKV